MMELLESQISKPSFWNVPNDWLITLGQTIWDWAGVKDEELEQFCEESKTEETKTA